MVLKLIKIVEFCLFFIFYFMPVSTLIINVLHIFTILLIIILFDYNDNDSCRKNSIYISPQMNKFGVYKLSNN